MYIRLRQFTVFPSLLVMIVSSERSTENLPATLPCLHGLLYILLGDFIRENHNLSSSPYECAHLPVKHIYQDDQELHYLFPLIDTICFCRRKVWDCDVLHA